MKTNKILVVDDEPLTCQLIAKMLTLQGYIPIVLTDSDQVLGVVESERPNLILMDYYLGTGLGLDLLQQLKNNTEVQAIPVIITSGMNKRTQAIDAGATAFILKPFDWNELMQHIKTALNSELE